MKISSREFLTAKFTRAIIILMETLKILINPPNVIIYGRASVRNAFL